MLRGKVAASLGIRRERSLQRDPIAECPVDVAVLRRGSARRNAPWIGRIGALGPSQRLLASGTTMPSRERMRRARYRVKCRLAATQRDRLGEGLRLRSPLEPPIGVAKVDPGLGIGRRRGEAAFQLDDLGRSQRREFARALRQRPARHLRLAERQVEREPDQRQDDRHRQGQPVAGRLGRKEDGCRIEGEDAPLDFDLGCLGLVGRQKSAHFVAAKLA
jgi:hypothetical protein